MILHPRHWRTFEADFSSRKRGFGDRRIPIDAIEPFIAKYCTNLVDCHLTAETFRSVPSLFNTLLQIKTLRRLAICTESSGFGRSQIAIEASQLVEPQCKDLVLLHLKSVILKPDALQALLLVRTSILVTYYPYVLTNRRTCPISRSCTSVSLLCLPKFSNLHKSCDNCRLTMTFWQVLQKCSGYQKCYRACGMWSTHHKECLAVLPQTILQRWATLLWCQSQH